MFSSDDLRSDPLTQHYVRRFWWGIAICLLLAVPAGIHSAAAIATLRNKPVEWIPETMPLRQEFNTFVEKFGITDIIFISWPGAHLSSTPSPASTQRSANGQPIDEAPDTLATAVALLSPLSAEVQATRRAGSDEPIPENVIDGSEKSSPNGGQHSGERPDWVDAFYADARRICDSPTPLDWLRSGTEMRDALTSPPLSFSDESARRRLTGTMIGDDGLQTGLTVSLGLSAMDHHAELIPMLREAIGKAIGQPTEQIACVGGPVDGVAVDNAAIRSINRFSLPSSMIAALLCWICLRSIPLSLAIAGVATIGQGMVLAMVYYAGIEMNAVLIVLPPLVFVLTVSAGIHLSNYFLDTAREMVEATVLVPTEPLQSRVQLALAAKEAMRLGVKPCFLATFTTVVGLSSLTLVRLEPVRVFGVAASLGVLLTLGLLILVLPGAMLLTPVKRLKNTASTQSVWLDRFIDGQLRFPWVVILFFAIVATLMTVGLGRLKTSVNVPEMFAADSELRQQYAWYEANVGATMTGDVLITYQPKSGDDASPIAQLIEVSRVHMALARVEGVGGVISAATFLPGVSMSRSLSSTATRSVVRDKLDDRDSSVYQLGFLRAEGDDGSERKTWRISLRLFQTSDHDFGETITDMEQIVDEVLAKSSPAIEPDVSLTGHLVVVQRSQEILLQDLFRSFIAAFAIIAVVMILFLRSVIGGVVSMIPNLVPTVVLFGMMGWLRFPLDIGSVMTASVALGIAVDDNVHLLSRYRNFHHSGLTRARAAEKALRQCGGAMLQTTIVCSLSLMAYGLSDFVPTRRFAFFMLGLLTVAWLCVSILLPALMASSLGKRLARSSESARPEASPEVA